MSRAALLLVALLAVAPARAAPRPLLAGKSEIGFSVTQMGVAVTGVFKEFTATVDLDPAKPETGSAALDVNVASIATGNDEADDTARGAAWLDAAGAPKATFRSKSVKALGGERYQVIGTLTLKGKAHDLTVPLTLKAQPDGGLVASGEFTLRRTEFGIGGGEWNKSDLVADEVPVHFKLIFGPPKTTGAAK